MSQQKLQTTALDGGFGNFKLAYLNGDGTIHTRSFPSVVGLGNTDLGMLSTGFERRNVAQVKPYVVEFDASGFGLVKYLVGPNVHRWGESSQRLDFQRLYEGPQVKAMTLVGLGLMNPVEPVAILQALPVEALQKKEVGQAILAGQRSWLVGEHVFKLDGRERRVTVSQIKAMPQPLGSYFFWGLDPHGVWIKSEDDFNALTVVADIGFNTLDLFGIERGRVIGHYTGGQNLGMHNAAAGIARQVREQYGIELSLHQADELLQVHIAGQEAVVYQNGKHQVAAIVQQALDEAFAGISDFLRAHWKKGGYNKVIITGGGAKALRKPLLQQYPAAFVPTDPVTANADGLARFAARTGGIFA